MKSSGDVSDPIIELDGNAWVRMRSYDVHRALLDRADHRNHICAIETQSLRCARVRVI
jgi:hypothetical protein